jgi:hypothetical protein
MKLGRRRQNHPSTADVSGLIDGTPPAIIF